MAVWIVTVEAKFRNRAVAMAETEDEAKAEALRLLSGAAEEVDAQIVSVERYERADA